MYEGKTIGVVVPAYNEAALVGSVIDTMPAFVDRVYVVDDASTDGTWTEIARHAAAANDRRDPAATLADGGESRFVVPIHHEVNRGPGGARKTGYARALADGIDVVATMDADGQMDPAYLGRILDPVVSGRADYAKGTRLKSREFWREMPPFRLFGNLLLTFLTKIASGYWGMTDPQNGYTAISREALSAIEIESLYDDYGYLNDVLTSLNVRSRRIADVPHPARYGTEHSGIRYSTFVPSLSGVLLKNFLRRLKTRYLLLDFHPLAFLYGLSVVGFLMSAFAAVGAIRARLADRITPDRSLSIARSPSADPSSLARSGTSVDRRTTKRPADGSDPTDRSAFAHGLTALETFLFGAVVLVLAIVFDARANDDLVVRVEDTPAVDPSGSRKPADRGGGE